jgi:hypothetical protein
LLVADGLADPASYLRGADRGRGGLQRRWLRAAIDRIGALFEEAGIAWVAMKGAHVRECVYPDPALRAASDIDLLILPEDRRRAARVLLDAGYTAHVEPANISHEATFSQVPSISICTGTCRRRAAPHRMTAELIARRQRTNGVRAVRR